MIKSVIGLTGSFGSGCTTQVVPLLESRSYRCISLSKLLRAEYAKANPEITDPSRQQLQAFGDSLREENGCGYLAQQAVAAMREAPGQGKWVIDSIRNPEEADFIKSECLEFYLFAVFAEYQTRWRRVMSRYDNDERAFKADDERDAGERFRHGQRVTDCYILADAMVNNNVDFQKSGDAQEELEAKINRLVGLVEHTKPFIPTEAEALMAVTFANSLRSSCMKRKVGAVIVDDSGHVFSSGYNEVPKDDHPCKYYGKCYRERLSDDLGEEIGEIIDGEKLKEIREVFRKRFKNLDYCKALHAEESAILNVARFGSSTALRGGTLYVTTYPCNLCANKIVQVGLSRVLYLEPYPMPEAKEILQHGRVQEVSFEGVSFNGYFRFKREV